MADLPPISPRVRRIVLAACAAVVAAVLPAAGCTGRVTDPNGVEWGWVCAGPTAVPSTPTPGSAHCEWAPITPAPTTGAPTSPPATPPTTVPPTTTAPTTPTTPSPDPTPGTQACPAFPQMPDANCTGVPTGVVLRSCPTVITQADSTWDSCRFDGGLEIRAANVTVTRSLVKGLVYAIYVTNWDLSGLKLIDVEIDGTGHAPNGDAAIGYDNYSCLRCDVHGSGRGFNFETNVSIVDSWAHDFAYINGAHQSAAGSNGGSGNKIVHNNLDCGSQGCSGALVMYGDFEPVNDNLIQNNLFNGGAYCLYAGSTGTASGKPYPHGTNLQFVDNRFGRKYDSSKAANSPGCGYYGPVAAWESGNGNVWSGNAWADGSGVVNP